MSVIARAAGRHFGPESAEGFTVTTFGPIVWASKTNRVATNKSFNQFQLTPGATITINGRPAGVTSQVAEMVYHFNSLWQESGAANDWFYWNTSTSDATPGTQGWVKYDLVGPIVLNTQAYTGGAVAGSVVASISVPVSSNAAGDTFPGVWGGTITIAGPDGPAPNGTGTFAVSGTNLVVAAGHTLSNSNQIYNITLTAQIAVTDQNLIVRNLGNALGPTPFQLTQAAVESAEGFFTTAVGVQVFASQTFLVASPTGPYNVFTLTSGQTVNLGSQPAGTTSNVLTLLYHNHTLFQENNTPQWWYWDTATSDSTPGTAGWVFFNLLGPITLSTLTYPANAGPGTTVATISVPMSSNIANDTFPGVWGGTLTLGGADGPGGTGTFTISGLNLNVAAGHTLGPQGQTYNISISAQVPVSGFNVGNQLGPTPFQLTNPATGSEFTNEFTNEFG